MTCHSACISCIPVLLYHHDSMIDRAERVAEVIIVFLPFCTFAFCCQKKKSVQQRKPHVKYLDGHDASNWAKFCVYRHPCQVVSGSLDQIVASAQFPESATCMTHSDTAVTDTQCCCVCPTSPLPCSALPLEGSRPAVRARPCCMCPGRTEHRACSAQGSPMFTCYAKGGVMCGDELRFWGTTIATLVCSSQDRPGEHKELRDSSAGTR